MSRKPVAAKLELAPDPNQARISSDPTKHSPNAEACRLPFDMPAFMTAYRLVEEGDEPEELNKGNGRTAPALSKIRGWTFEVNCFTMGVKVYVRIDRQDGTLKVFAEDSEGTTKLEEWSK